MAPTIENGKLRFSDEAEIDNDNVKRRLKRKYGRGIFIDRYTQSSDGAIFIRLGNAAPKDVSDCREHDRVLKFIEYGSIYTLEAEPVGNGYVIDLPDRKEVYNGFQNRKAKLARRLDRSMARAIYKKLVDFTPVKNQLGAIQSILRTVREESPIEVETLHEIRGTTPKEREKTESYIRLLVDTEFLRIENREQNGGGQGNDHPLMQDTRGVQAEDGRVIRSGANLDAHDERDIGTEEFNKLVLGQVIDKAYSTLKDELNITLLKHYPTFANSYYFTALERDKPDVKLDIEAAQENLSSLYGRDEHEITVRQKLDDLASVDVVRKEEEFYYSNDEVYQALVEQSAV